MTNEEFLAGVKFLQHKWGLSVRQLVKQRPWDFVKWVDRYHAEKESGNG